MWAGEIPLRTVRLDPVADPALRSGIAVPDHLATGPWPPESVPWRDLDGRLTRARGRSRLGAQSRNEASGVVVMPWASATGS